MVKILLNVKEFVAGINGSQIGFGKCIFIECFSHKRSSTCTEMLKYDQSQSEIKRKKLDITSISKKPASKL